MNVSTWVSRLFVAGLLVFAGAAQAAQSSAVFAYSGSPTPAQLQLTTTTGPVTLQATNAGWVDSSGSNNGSAVNRNYIAGTCGTDSCSGNGLETRNWFAFQMPAGVTLTITSATLSILVPNPTPPQQGVYTITGPLVYTLYDVTSPAATFTGATAGLAQFNDLGTGVVYGTRSYTTADQGTSPAITLSPAAITWLNTQNGNAIVLGGAATLQVPQAVPAPAFSVGSLSLLGLGILFAVGLLWRRGFARA